MRSKARQRMILIAAVVLVVVAVGAILITSFSPARAPVPATSVVQATPTGPRPDCGTVVRQTTNGGAAFPVINTTNCPPDTSTLQRKQWNSITARMSLSGSAINVCEDWYAYHTNQTGSWEIFRWSGDNQTVNLSRGGAQTNNLGPSLSPDRRTIAFTTDRDGNWEVYVANTDGTGEPQRITYNSFAVDLAPIWSPDGKRLIYNSIRKGNWDLFVFDVQAGEEMQLTDGPSNDLTPVWSPDGKKALYQSFRDGLLQMIEIDVDAGTTTKISDGKGSDSDPVYAPDGKQIAFLSTRGGNKAQLYTANADGSNVQAVSAPELVAVNQSFSPDGTMIAYQGTKDGAPSLYVYEQNTKKTRQVTASNIASYAPTWDCSSKTLVFTANVGKNPGLYSVAALPMDAAPVDVSKDAKPLTTGEAAAQYPVGAPREEKASKQSITGQITATLSSGG
jgi:Tol biopolymer transport system component